MDSEWTISTTEELTCTERIDILLVQGLIASRQRYAEKYSAFVYMSEIVHVSKTLTTGREEEWRDKQNSLDNGWLAKTSPWH